MHTTYVENITAFISNMRPSKSEESKPVGPVPVITIDGVDYYHKCEFDLTEYDYEETSNFDKAIDLLTGEEIIPDESCSYLRYYNSREATLVHYTNLILGKTTYSVPNFIIMYRNPNGGIVSYESHAFNMSDSYIFNNENDIYLPTCSAYYGFLSEDGKTFISYYNLKGE